MDPILKDASLPALITAIELNYVERFRLFRFWPQAEVHDEPHLFWTLTHIPFPLFNSVLRARLAPGEAERLIQAAVSRCVSHKVPMFWWTGPSTKPVNLGKYLEEHGFYKEDDAPGMAMDLTGLTEKVSTAPGLVVQRVEDAAGLALWYRTFNQVYSFPGFVETPWLDSFLGVGFAASRPLYCYLGLLRGEPVAVSFLVLGAGVAGIYGVGSVDEARGQGIGTVMTQIPLLEARRMGYRVGVLRSSQMGYSVYHRMGFRTYCELSLYAHGLGQ